MERHQKLSRGDYLACFGPRTYWTAFNFILVLEKENSAASIINQVALKENPKQKLLHQFWFFHARRVQENPFSLANNAFANKSRFFVLFFNRGWELVFSAVTAFVPALHFSGSLAHGARLPSLELL